MAVKQIKLGQVWRNNQSGKDFLVTKVYNEVFTQYAMLRVADATAPQSDTVRLKVEKSPEGASLPGFTYTQDAQDF